MSDFETSVKFKLPKGYVDKSGEVHKEGIMRLANAADEIMPLNDTRVKLNPGYFARFAKISYFLIFSRLYPVYFLLPEAR